MLRSTNLIIRIYINKKKRNSFRFNLFSNFIQLIRRSPLEIPLLGYLKSILVFFIYISSMNLNHLLSIYTIEINIFLK